LGEIIRLPREIRHNSLCGCGEWVYHCQFWRRINNRLKKKFNIDFYLYPESFSLFPQENQNSIDKLRRYSNLLIPGSKQPKWVKNTELLYEEIFEETGKSFLIDSTKSIKRAFWLKKFIKKWKFKFIYLVRDGRGVIYSMKKKFYPVYLKKSNSSYIKLIYPSPSSVDIATATKMWRDTNIKQYLLFKFQNRKDRFFLRFEDFLENPEHWLKKIFKWLNLPYQPVHLKFRKIAHHNISGNPSRLGNQPLHKPDHKWKTKLTEQELEYFNKHAGFLNRFFGYS